MTLWWNIEELYRPTIGWPAIPVPSFSFSPPAFILLPWRRLSQHSVQIRTANLIWSHDRANPSQLQNEKAVWRESIPRTSMGSFSQMPCPLQPRQCSNMMKRDPGEFGSLVLFMRKGIIKSRGTALKMERSSDQSVCLCVMCMAALYTFLSRRRVCPSPWWMLDVFGLGFLTHPWSTFRFTDWSHFADSGKQSCHSTQRLNSFLQSFLFLIFNKETYMLLLLYWKMNICINMLLFCLESPEVKTLQNQKTLPKNTLSRDAMFRASGDCRHKLCSIDCIDWLRLLKLLVVGRQLN